ncbi:MAG: hypothetical protein SAK29_08810 [Scytonema sp. PMC 1069.18]|nr:hypothetical protein [Scytonema sp. PMC 1069.18]MEC4884810.1 hypothetical protein [Scytonema sp. PMC 1070.18]
MLQSQQTLSAVQGSIKLQVAQCLIFVCKVGQSEGDRSHCVTRDGDRDLVNS